ncbi:MAG: CDP-alcohol phosphatidyltransferase family protein [Gammaproteobacteria bacterium]|nr:CDP-alcohol phosphatidyltransferase family protein [Gammaproteobacteria bacterium]
MLRYIPNLLSVVRILLVPPLLVLLLQGQYDWAFVVFALAGFTDGLDGFLARRYNWHTELGGLLDPVADKLLMVSMFVALAVAKLVPLALALLVIGRDVLIVTGLAVYRVLIGPVQAKASWVSKINTAVLLLFVLAVISDAGFSFPPPGVVIFFGAVVIVTTIISGLDYVREGVLRARPHYTGGG